MIRIITDSSSNITQEEAGEWGITVIPLTIIFNGKEYRDGVDISTDEFYKKLTSGKEFPHTSQISEEKLTEALDACGKDDEIIVMPISRGLSGSYSMAKAVAERPEYSNVTVYDTRCTTIMLKMLVQYTIAHKGESAKNVCKGLDKLRRRIRLYACLNTLEYLKKGGRLGSATATIGELLKIKPVITVNDEGGLTVLSKALGMRHGISNIVDLVKKDKIEGTPVFIHTMDDKNAKTLAEKCGDKFKNIVSENMCPVIGAHIGPAACGIVYIAKE